MAAYTIFALCALAFIQNALSQCLPCGGCGFIPAASTGGSFVVTSSSPVAPTGVSVVSENVYEGALLVEGNLPLLGSVALEGTMGTAGAGAVSYGCGDGSVGIVAEEGPIVTGIADTVPGYLGLYGSGLYGLGYGDGLYGLGLGSGIYGLGYGNGFYGLGYGNGLYGFGGWGCYGRGYGLGAIY